MKISVSDLSHSAQIEINNLSQNLRQSARGSLECLLSGSLKTHGADINDIEAYVIASLRAMKAEQDWDQCPIESEEWNEKADHARHCASVAGILLKKIL